VQPEFLSTLVVTFPKGERRLRSAVSDREPLALDGLAREMECFLSQFELARTIFRSDHASNWLVLKGTLNTDEERLLTQVRAALENPQAGVLRLAWARRL
jgi:hypothetical protein